MSNLVVQSMTGAGFFYFYKINVPLVFFLDVPNCKR